MKKFKQKPIGHRTQSVVSSTASLQEKIFWRGVVVLVLVLAYFFGWLSSRAQSIGNGIAYIAGSTIGTELEQDTQERINIALAGYGGVGHEGAFLTDTIIVASYNPQKQQATLISIPRDLIVVNDESGEVTKINSILAYAYDHNGRNLHQATVPFRQKLQEITGLHIPYYMMIDFDGFIQLIDDMGGLDIYVPEHFIDMAFPIDRSGEEEIFELPQGDNHLSGPNTLKYARSRHSTSDFSRAQRQQQIIKAVLKQMMGGDGISLQGVQKLFTTYKTIVETNISDRDLVGLTKYGLTVPDIAMYGLTSQCLENAWRINPRGCVLRDAVGGLLPRKAAPGEAIDQYDDMRSFIEFVVEHPGVNIENTPLTIFNATSKELSDQHPEVVGLATRTANHLVNLGFNVVDVTNSEVAHTGSMIEGFGENNYNNTLEALYDALEQNLDQKSYTGFANQEGWTRQAGLYLYLGDDNIVSSSGDSNNEIILTTEDSV